MRGLCHKCFGSNMETIIYEGSMYCKDCFADTRVEQYEKINKEGSS